MWNLHLERTAFQNRYLDRWNKAGIDAIVCPTTPWSTTKHTGLRHGKSLVPSMRSHTDDQTVAYTGVFNVVDYSAVSFATGMKVDKNVDRLGSSYEPLSPLCKSINEECEYNIRIIMRLVLIIYRRR